MVFRYMTPRYQVGQLHRSLNRLFDSFATEGVDAWWPRAAYGPAANVWETDEAVKVELEVPGLKSDHIDLSVVGDELTITVERPDAEEEDVTYLRRERGLGSFTRVLRLPVEVDADRVEAKLSHGVLTVTLPKAARVLPKKIQVSPAG